MIIWPGVWICPFMIVKFVLYDGIGATVIAVAPEANDSAPRRRVAVAICMLP